jgi:hypothetical protein
MFELLIAAALRGMPDFRYDAILRAALKRP